MECPVNEQGWALRESEAMDVGMSKMESPFCGKHDERNEKTS